MQIGIDIEKDMQNNKLKRIDTSAEIECCGCMACENACPQKAISMTENEKGFIMPSIDEEKCVNCGLCLKICDFKKIPVGGSNIEHAYSLVINDRIALKKSTSGGAFTALSDVVLDDSGYVVGSVMDEKFNVHHTVAANKAERDKMCGSKYVQSCTHGIWEQVKELLLQEKKVMFTGTPCQCAALKSFLGKEYDNLTVVDFLCHGVPNNRMFREHIEYLNDFYGVPSVGFSFRNKTYGWDSYNNIDILFNGKSKTKWINQIYYSFFVNNLSLRPSCHHCTYRRHNRPSDITVADFWGIEKLTYSKDRDGVSLVLTHSEKGLDLVKKAKEACRVREYPMESVMYRIPLVPSKPNAKCDSFWKTYVEHGYSRIASKYFRNSLKNRFRFEVRKIAKKLRIG